MGTCVGEAVAERRGNQGRVSCRTEVQFGRLRPLSRTQFVRCGVEFVQKGAAAYAWQQIAFWRRP